MLLNLIRRYRNFNPQAITANGQSRLMQWLFGSRSPSPAGVIYDNRQGLGTSRDIQPGRCYKFDGTDDYIIAPAAIAVTSAGTVVVDFMTSAIDGNLRALVDLGDTGVTGCVIWGNTGTSTGLGFSYGTGAGISSTSVAATANTRYRIVLTWSGSNISFYVNGTLNVSYSNAVLTNITAYSFYMGAQAGSIRFFDNKIYTIEAYSDEKNAAWVAEDYANPLYKNDVTNRTAFFKCDDNHNKMALDSSGNRNNGTKVNITAATFNASGNDAPYSYQNEFGYTDARMLAGDGAFGGLQFTTPLTWTSIVYEICRGAQVQYNDGAFGLTNNGFFLTDYTNSLFRVYTPGLENVSAPGVPDYTKRFRQFIIQRNADNTISYYSGDTLICTSTTTTTESLSNLNYGWGAGEVCMMRNVRIYSARLSAGEKATVAAGGRVTNNLTNEFLGYGETPYTDQVGSAATVEGASNYTMFAPRDESSKTQDVLTPLLNYSGEAPMNALVENSYCGTFDGVDDFIDIPETAITGTNYTLSFWARVTDVSAQRALGGKTGDNESYLFLFLSGSSIAHKCNVGGGNYAGITSGLPTLLNTARHYIVRRNGNGNNFDFFIDGVKYPAEYFGATIPNNPSTQTMLGKFNAGLPFQGQMWGYYAYNSTLTDEQCEAMFTGVYPAGAVRSYPICEGGGSRVYDTVGTNHGTITNATVTPETGFWANTQDNYHYNIISGFSKRQNYSQISATTTDWIQDAATLTMVADPDGNTNAMRIVPSDLTLGIHRIYVSTPLAANNQYLIVYAKPVGTAQSVLGLQFTTGSYATVEVTTGALTYSLNATLVSSSILSNGWTKIVLNYTDIGTGVIQLWAGNSTNVSFTPTNTTDGLDLYWTLADSADFEVLPTTGTALISNCVPAKISGLTDGAGLPIINPAGAWHNGAESTIDFTGGVTSPQTSGWETAWEFNTARVNPLFKRTRTTSGLARKADRFLAYDSALSGADLTQVQNYTTTIEG